MNHQLNPVTKLKKWTLYAALFSFVCVPIKGSSAEANFQDVAKKAIPSVVSIKVKTAMPARGTLQRETRGYQPQDPFELFNEDFFQHFFRQPRNGMQPQESQQVAQATGYIVSEDGYVLTNAHVVQNATEVNISLNDGREFQAKVIGVDTNTDVAIVKIEAKNLPFLTFGNSDELEIGQWVMAVGNPLGLQASVTAGIVSAKGRNNLDLVRIEDFIQTDAAINRGNSGGPLLNLKSEVIGMNTAMVSNMGSGGYMGIGFAIPSNLVHHIMSQLIDKGTVTRGFMGVTLQEINNDLAQAFGLDSVEGALISDISKNSPAETAGIKQGDVILEYNNKRVTSMTTLRNAVSLMKPGAVVNLRVLRNGKKMSIPITVGTYPEDDKQVAVKEETLGIDVETLTPEMASKLGHADLTGVVITNVSPGSVASFAGLKKGALIAAVNHKEIQSAEDFRREVSASDPNKPILFLVKDGEYMQFISIKMG